MSEFMVYYIIYIYKQQFIVIDIRDIDIGILAVARW